MYFLYFSVPTQCEPCHLSRAPVNTKHTSYSSSSTLHRPKLRSKLWNCQHPTSRRTRPATHGLPRSVGVFDRQQPTIGRWHKQQSGACFRLRNCRRRGRGVLRSLDRARAHAQHGPFSCQGSCCRTPGSVRRVPRPHLSCREDPGRASTIGLNRGEQIPQPSECLRMRGAGVV